MKIIACYFFYAALSDCYITQSIIFDGKVYFHIHPHTQLNFAYPQNITAAWRVKYKNI
jgi:hypothetical protein